MSSPQYSPEFIGDCIRTAFPASKVANAQLLSGGLINTNIKIEFGSDQRPVVLRIYQGDAAANLKESAIIHLVHSTVRVPEVIHAEPDGINGSPPFCILEFVNGLTFEQLKRTKDRYAIHQAAASVGQTLAEIGKYQFARPGLLGGNFKKELLVEEGFNDDADPIPRLLDQFLQSQDLQRRLDAPVRQQLHDLLWSWSTELRALHNERNLVHCDFGNRNLLVDCVNGRWQVVAVLDWEFAVSGSQLIDVGHFLRYEPQDSSLREPFFSRAFVEYGGVLPDDWRRISRILDLTGLVHCLTHPHLPDDVAREILQLIASTVETCKL